MSVITVVELHAGVLAAADVTTRAWRLASVESTADIRTLKADVAAARTWAHMRAVI